MEKPDQESSFDGKSLINQLSVVLRTSHLHNTENVAVASSIERLRSLVIPQIERDSLCRIDLVGEYFYVNDSRVRYPMEFHLNFDYLSKEFKARELGTVTFSSILSMDDIKAFLDAFMKAEDSATPFGAMEALLENTNNISIKRLKIIQEDDTEDLDRRKVIKKAYFNAVSCTKGIMTKLQTGEKISIKKAKRIVESMVKFILSEDQLLMGMTAIKDYDEYTYHHCVNVSVLSIAIAQKIGVNRSTLTDLGLVALFHDIGKVGIPIEILNKPNDFSDEDWKVMKTHPFLGLQEMLKFKELDRTSIQCAIAASQHHMHYDLSGYPKLREPLGIDFLTKIVSMADQYDAMTSSRAYSRVPYPPDKTLSVMMERAGTQIDPILFKFFVNLVGIYPVGSLVLLDTKELGLVYESNPLLSDRPKVLIIVDHSGKRVDGFKVDLATKDASGKHVRNVVKTLDSNKYKVNLAEYLL